MFLSAANRSMRNTQNNAVEKTKKIVYSLYYSYCFIDFIRSLFTTKTTENT